MEQENSHPDDGSPFRGLHKIQVLNMHALIKRTLKLFKNIIQIEFSQKSNLSNLNWREKTYGKNLLFIFLEFKGNYDNLVILFG